MPLLEVTPNELLMLREAIDAKAVTLEAHRLRTSDPFVAAAIRADIESFIVLRQIVVNAGRPVCHTDLDRWEQRKAYYDAQQDADIGGGLVL